MLLITGVINADMSNGAFRTLGIAALSVMISGCAAHKAGSEGVSCPPSMAPMECHYSYLWNQVQTDPDFKLYDANGWLVALKMRPEEQLLWSFVPRSHPAFPALAARSLHWYGTRYQIRTAVVCLDDNDICQEFINEVEGNNDALRGMECPTPEERPYVMDEIIDRLRVQ